MKKRVVFRGKFITVRQWWQPLPKKKRELYEQIDRPGTVITIPVDDHGQVILIREGRFGLRQFVWHTATGRIDHGETSKAAAMRELREEAGYTANHWRKLSDRTNNGLIRWRTVIYLARGLSRTAQRLDPLEEIRPVSISLRRAYDLAISGRIHYPTVAYYLIRLWHNRKQWLR